MGTPSGSGRYAVRAAAEERTRIRVVLAETSRSSRSRSEEYFQMDKAQRRPWEDDEWW